MTEVAVVEDTTTAIAISFEDARALTDQIKQSRDDLWELVIRAYQAEAWKVLEYDTWDAYMTQEFGDSRLALPREKRKGTVQSLRDNGLSIRAIASATGKAKSTIEADLNGDAPKKKGKVSRNRDTAEAPIEAEVVEAVTEEPERLFLVVDKPEVGEGFPDNMIGWGTTAAGAALLDADVVLFYGGEEVGVVRTGPARILAAALLEAANHADAAAPAE